MRLIVRFLERFQEDEPLLELEAVASPEQVMALQRVRKQIRVSPPVREYIVDIIEATRRNKLVRFGASPRGSLGLMRAGQALAALRGQEYVLPDDIKYLAHPVLAHRLILREEEQLRGETPEHVLDEILAHVPIPASTD